MTRPNDGLFYTQQGHPFALSWRIRSQAAYRLEPVTDLPGALKVPAPADRLFTHLSLPDILIVVSERGGGISFFLQWLLRAEGVSVSDSAGTLGKHRSPKRKIGSKWTRLSLPQAHRELVEWAAQGEKPNLNIIIDRTNPEEPEDAEIRSKLAEIVSIIEEPEWKVSASKVICATREVHRLKIDRLYSNLLSRGQACRLPHFSPPELSQWNNELFRKMSLKGGVAPEELAKDVKRWVGGQPTLTHFFFRFVDDRMADQPGSVLHELFQKAGRYLQDHRPHIVDRWALDLQDLLELPAIRHRLEIYASGGTKDPNDPDFDDEDAQLFLAGWVGLNPDNRWGIRSLCHQHWAREILRG